MIEISFKARAGALMKNRENAQLPTYNLQTFVIPKFMSIQKNKENNA